MPIVLRQIAGIWSFLFALMAMVPTFFSMGHSAWAAPKDIPLAAFFSLWAFSSASVKLAMIHDKFLSWLNAAALIMWVGMIVYVNTRYSIEFTPSLQALILASWVVGWPMTDLADLMVPEKNWTKTRTT